MLNGEPMQPPMSVMSDFYRNATREDLLAMAAYLKSLPPRRLKAPPRKLTEEGLRYAEERRAFIAERKAAEQVVPEAQPAITATGEGEP